MIKGIILGAIVTYFYLERPEDLITAKEAGTMAGKSLATIRSWVRKGKITGHRKDPKKKNSTLMISQEELQAYLALNAQPNHPNVKGRPDTLSVSLTDKDKRIEELEKQLQDKKFSMVEIKGLEFNPLLNKWKKSNNLSVNYIIASSKS